MGAYIQACIKYQDCKGNKKCYTRYGIKGESLKYNIACSDKSGYWTNTCNKHTNLAIIQKANRQAQLVNLALQIENAK